MHIKFDSNDKFNLEWNEYNQFSLYDKEGNAQHYQMCTADKSYEEKHWTGGRNGRWIMTVEAYPINSLTVETKEEKVAKESVKKAKEALKAAEDTLKAVKEMK